MKVGIGLEIRELRAEEVGQAAALTARGMRDNPTHIEAFGRADDKRERKLVALFGSVLPIVSAKAVLMGAYREGTLVGIAGLAGPGNCRPSASDSLRILPRLLPRVGAASMMKMGKWQGVWKKHDPTKPHWHLGPLVVDRHLQGQRIGSALLEEVCERMDRQGTMLYLETDKPENVRFYQKHGFEIIGQAPVLDVTNWFMMRETRT